MKRYAIVRVDGRHKPSHFECERIENITDLKLLDEVVKEYGDTKEQLVAKVEQVIREKTDNGIIVRYREKSISAEELARKIVEFLGVE